MKHQRITQPILFQHRLVLILALGMGLILACNLPIATPTPISDTCNLESEPTQKDITYALEFTGDTFSDWNRSYTVHADRVTITWAHQDKGAIAFLEYLFFRCGYTQADIDAHFSEQNFQDIILRDYENLQSVATCTDTRSDLTLHEFTGALHETDYVIRFWVTPDSETYALNMMLVFPATAEAELDKYAQRVFPELSACQR